MLSFSLGALQSGLDELLAVGLFLVDGRSLDFYCFDWDIRFCGGWLGVVLLRYLWWVSGDEFEYRLTAE
jgi:hypothetical protein